MRARRRLEGIEQGEGWKKEGKAKARRKRARQRLEGREQG